MEKTQSTINERLKFLLDHYNLSARNFGRAIGVPENNTQNYLGPKGASPKADYLERILRHFQSVNPMWLLTGEGEPLTNTVEATMNFQKKNTGNVVGTNHGTVGPAQDASASLERELQMAQQIITQLQSQLQDKERLIRLYESASPLHLT